MFIYREVIQEPAIEPVSLEEQKNYMRVDHSNDDTLITSLIKSSRRYLENYCNRAFITQTIIQIHDDGEHVIRLLLPLQSITSVKIYDAEENEDTLTLNDDYYKNSKTGELRKANEKWPEAPSYVEIIYKAGYGDNASDVPEGIRTAIKRLTAYLYERREEFVFSGKLGDETFEIGEIPFDIKSLVAPYRVLRVL